MKKTILKKTMFKKIDTQVLKFKAYKLLVVSYKKSLVVMRFILGFILGHWKFVVLSTVFTLTAVTVIPIFISIKYISNTDSIGLLFKLNNPEERALLAARAVSGSLRKVNVNVTLTLRDRADIAAKRHGIDPYLFRALVTQESAWKPEIISRAGAAGLTQLMPATAKSECGLEHDYERVCKKGKCYFDVSSGDERLDPDKNLNCGAKYLAKQLRRFKSVDLALAAYNSGPSRVAKLGRVPRIPETQNYVAIITKSWKTITKVNKGNK